RPRLAAKTHTDPVRRPSPFIQRAMQPQPDFAFDVLMSGLRRIVAQKHRDEAWHDFHDSGDRPVFKRRRKPYGLAIGLFIELAAEAHQDSAIARCLRHGPFRHDFDLAGHSPPPKIPRQSQVLADQYCFARATCRFGNQGRMAGALAAPAETMKSTSWDRAPPVRP